MNFYKVINIFGKNLIFLPASMILLESNDKINEEFKYGFEHPEADIQHDIKQLITVENDAQRYLQQLKTSDNFINSIQINMINACNMRCKYCFADGGSHHKNNVMTKEQAKAVIDYTFEHLNGNMLSVVVIGGEPMLNMPVFEYILYYCRKKALDRKINVRFIGKTRFKINY